MVRQRPGSLRGQTIICCAFCKESGQSRDEQQLPWHYKCFSLKYSAPEWVTQVKRVKGSEPPPRAVDEGLGVWNCPGEAVFICWGWQEETSPTELKRRNFLTWRLEGSRKKLPKEPWQK